MFFSRIIGLHVEENPKLTLTNVAPIDFDNDLKACFLKSVLNLAACSFFLKVSALFTKKVSVPLIGVYRFHLLALTPF